MMESHYKNPDAFYFTTGERLKPELNLGVRRPTFCSRLSRDKFLKTCLSLQTFLRSLPPKTSGAISEAER